MKLQMHPIIFLFMVFLLIVFLFIIFWGDVFSSHAILSMELVKGYLFNEETKESL